jgi:hypothetical protein
MCWAFKCDLPKFEKRGPENSYSCQPILLFTNTDVSTTKMYLDTSILEKSIMGRKEY